MKRGYATATDAAKAFGWNVNSYKSHENGVRGITPRVARKYASAFKSTAAYILTGDNHAPVVHEVLGIPLRGIVAAGMFEPSDWAPKMAPKSPRYITRAFRPRNNMHFW